MELTARDKKIIRLVARFRFLRSTQILQFVPGAKAQLLRRLQLLFHHGWLDRPRCQIDYYNRSGSAPMVYGLGTRGVAFMRREHDLPFQRMTWGRGGKDVGRVFLEHALMTAEILITLEKVCRTAAEQIRFIGGENLNPKREAREPFQWTTREQTQRITVIPDGVFALEFQVSEKECSRVIVCLEADRGTMPVNRRGYKGSSIARKFAGYAGVWNSGRLEKHFQTRRLIVLTVTESDDRLASIQACAAQMPSGKGLFYSCTLNQLKLEPEKFIAHCQPARRDKPPAI